MKTLKIRFKPGPVEPDLLRPPRKTLDLKKRSWLLVSMFVSQQNVFSMVLRSYDPTVLRSYGPTIQTVDFHTDTEREESNCLTTSRHDVLLYVKATVNSWKTRAVRHFTTT